MIIARSYDQRPSLWIQTTVTYATTNRIGEMILTPSSKRLEDAEDLVESVKKMSSDEIVWATFCKLIDRALLFGFFILYFFMVVSLLPEGYMSINYDPIEISS